MLRSNGYRLNFILRIYTKALEIMVYIGKIIPT
jgi:hypothetical protein